MQAAEANHPEHKYVQPGQIRGAIGSAVWPQLVEKRLCLWEDGDDTAASFRLNDGDAMFNCLCLPQFDALPVLSLDEMRELYDEQEAERARAMSMAEFAEEALQVKYTT